MTKPNNGRVLSCGIFGGSAAIWSLAAGWTRSLPPSALGGTLANLLILLPYLLALAVLAVIQLRLLGWPASIAVAVVLVGGALLTAFSYAIAQARPEATAQTWGDRETFGRRMAVIGGIVGRNVWIIQPVLLSLIAEGLGKADWHKAAAAITGGGLGSVIMSVSRVVLTSPNPTPAGAGGTPGSGNARAAVGAIRDAWSGLLCASSTTSGQQKTAGLGLAASAVLVALGRFLPDQLRVAARLLPRPVEQSLLLQASHTQRPFFAAIRRLPAVRCRRRAHTLSPGGACLNISDTPSRSEDLTKEYMRPGRRGGFFLFPEKPLETMRLVTSPH